jgi:hypothetical protein
MSSVGAQVGWFYSDVIFELIQTRLEPREGNICDFIVMSNVFLNNFFFIVVK